MNDQDTIEQLRRELFTARWTSHKVMEDYQTKLDKVTKELATANKRIESLAIELEQAKKGVFVTK